MHGCFRTISGLDIDAVYKIWIENDVEIQVCESDQVSPENVGIKTLDCANINCLSYSLQCFTAIYVYKCTLP